MGVNKKPLHLKLEILGNAPNGCAVHLIRTAEKPKLYGVHYLGECVLFWTKNEALGFGAHLIDPHSRRAREFWKSSGVH